MKKRKRTLEHAPMIAKVLGSTPPPPGDATGAEAAYDEFKTEARGIDPQEVKTFTGSANVALQNVKTGVESVVAERVRIESDPDAPKVDFVRIETTVRVAHALVFAALRASHAVDPKASPREQVSEAFELRDVILASAVALAKAGRLDPREVAKIQAGTGPLDAAEDCIALAALFRREARRIAGASPITDVQLARAAELGTELVSSLKPTGAHPKVKRPTPVSDAAVMRDRMAALLRRHHAYVVKVGGWLWGYDVADHVPPLGSRAVVSGASEEAPEAPTESAPKPPTG